MIGRWLSLLAREESHFHQILHLDRTSMSVDYSMAGSTARGSNAASPWRHLCTRWSQISNDRLSGVQHLGWKFRHGSQWQQGRTSWRKVHSTSTSLSQSQKSSTPNLASSFANSWSRKRGTPSWTYHTSPAHTMLAIIREPKSGSTRRSPRSTCQLKCAWKKIWKSTTSRHHRRCRGKRSKSLRSRSRILKSTMLTILFKRKNST